MQHKQRFELVTDAILFSSGETNSQVRVLIEEAAASTVKPGNTLSIEPLPEPLIGYVNKVARYAYKVTSEEIDGLVRAGYTEDAIFEMTLSAALGASKARLETALTCLEEVEK